MVDFGQQSEIVNIKCTDDTPRHKAVEFCRKELAKETVVSTHFFDEVPCLEVDYTMTEADA